MKNRIKMLLLLSMAASSVVLNASFNDDGSPEHPGYEWAVARWMDSDDVSEQEHYEHELTAASAYRGHRDYAGRSYGLKPGDSFYYLGDPYLAKILAMGNPAGPAQVVAAQAAQPQAAPAAKNSSSAVVQVQLAQAASRSAAPAQAISVPKHSRNSAGSTSAAVLGSGGGSSERELAQELINDQTIHIYFRTRSPLPGERKASPGTCAIAQSASSGSGGGGGDAPERAEKQDADLKKKLNQAISRRNFTAFKAVLHNPKLLDLDCRNAVGNTIFRACLFLKQDFLKALINSGKQISQWDADNLLDHINRLRCVPILDKASRNKETKLKKIEQFLVNDTGGRNASGKSDGTCRFRYTNTPAERKLQPKVVSAADSDTSTADAASAGISSARKFRQASCCKEIDPVRAAIISTAAQAARAQLAAVAVKRSATSAGFDTSASSSAVSASASAASVLAPAQKATKANTSGSDSDEDDDDSSDSEL